MGHSVEKPKVEWSSDKPAHEVVYLLPSLQARIKPARASPEATQQSLQRGKLTLTTSCVMP